MDINDGGPTGWSVVIWLLMAWMGCGLVKWFDQLLKRVLSQTTPRLIPMYPNGQPLVRFDLSRRDMLRIAAEDSPSCVDAYLRELGQGPNLDRIRELEHQIAGYAAADAAPPTGEIFFDPSEPESFAAYGQQPQIVEYLAASVRAMREGHYRLPPQLLVGPAGLGKTILAKVVANEIRQRVGQPTMFVETIGSGIRDGAALDSLVRRCAEREGSVLFIDEIHALKWDDFGERLYPLLQDQRYQFLDEPNMTELPDFTIIGATTELGRISSPAQRRFEIHMLKPASPAEIERIVFERRDFPITPEACVLLVSRTHQIGAPWDALKVRRRAMVFAQGRDATTIEEEDVVKVFELEEIDANGLRREHREVIEYLLRQPPRLVRWMNREVHCMSEANLIASSRVDPKYFRDRIRPWLMATGMLQVLGSYGHTLTPLAEATYGAKHHG